MLLVGALGGSPAADTLPSVTITANGQGDPLTLGPNASLQIAITTDGGTSGFANPSDLYVGLAAPFGVLFLSDLGFTPTVKALYHGPLPSFGPVPLFNIPNVSVLPPGNYTWFILVSGSTGFVVDTVQTTITLTPPPAITNLSPASGLAGTAVTITGNNFGATKGASTVRFNGMTAATTSWSATSIVATVPAGATTGNVAVTVANMPSNGVPFTVPTLVSIAVMPSTLSLPLKSRQQYVARGTYSDSSTRDLSAAATWTSSNPEVGDVASGGVLTALMKGQTTVQADVGGVSGSTAATVVRGSFIRVGDLHTARVGHTATLLPSGKVLIAGGQNGPTILASAELYDPQTGLFAPVGNMSEARRSHTATLLPSGLVLIAGGIHYEPDVDSLRSTELFDPSTGTFMSGGTMNADHFFHTATLLAGGQVLIAGGHYLTSEGGGSSPAELYDPASHTFALTGDLLTPRSIHTATRLSDGHVLVVGGHDSDGFELASAEVYDPVAGTFSAAGNLGVPRSYHTATLLESGRVLVAGGLAACPAGCGAETWDPATQTFAATSAMSTARGAHSGTLVADGSILVVGGQNSTENTGTAELFDPLSRTFTAAGALGTPRWGHTETRLNDGTVLLAGGSGNNDLRTAELYAPILPAPQSLQITPADVTMLVGGTQQFTVVDHFGHPRDDAEWTVSNASIATLTPDARPTLTATAAGTLTLTATVQGLSVDTDVDILSGATLAPGTLRWSIPTVGGLAPKQIVKSVPVPEGPSVFSVSGSGTETVVQAFTPDGQALWQDRLPVSNGNAVPDAIGGLLVTLYNGCDHENKMRILNIDGPTGLPVWEVVGVSACTVNAPQFAFRPNGVIMIATPGNTSGLPEVMMVDNLTGQILSTPPVPPSTFEDITGTPFQGYSRIGPPVVDPDGVAYVAYEVRYVAYPPRVVTTSLWLMKIDTNNVVSHIRLTTTDTDTNLFPGTIIPDGRGGVVATWTFSPSQPPADPSPLRAAHVSAGGSVSEYNLPIQPLQVLIDPTAMPVNPTLVLGDNDRAFVSYGTDLAAFNVNTGAALWTYSSAPLPISIVAAQGNALAAKVMGANGLDTVLRFTEGGAPSTEGWTGGGLNYVAGDLWTGLAPAGLNMYVGGPIEFSSVYAAAAQAPANTAGPLLLVSNPSNAGANQTAITDTLTKIKAGLAAPIGASCAAWYQTTGFSALDILNTFTPAQSYGYGDFNAPRNDIAAFVGGVNHDTNRTPVGVPITWAFTVNKNNAFYLQNFVFNGRSWPSFVGPRNYRGPNLRARAFILLHELAHIMHVSMFLSDFGNASQGPLNDALVDKNCRTLIEGIQ